MIGFKDFLVTNPGMEKDDHIAYMRAKRRKSQDYGNNSEENKGLWHNIHQKRKRGEPMRKKGEKGAPTAAAMKSAKSESSAAWAKSLETIAKKRQLDKISPKDKDTLKKIMALLNKEKK